MGYVSLAYVPRLKEYDMKLEELTDVIIGGLVIEVNSPNSDLINNGLLGHYLPANLEIGIRDDLPRQLQGNVLIHEVVHAIANVYCEGLGLDEAQVSGIAQGFHQVLTDNEDLVRFVTMTKACDCNHNHKECSKTSESNLESVMNGHVRNRGEKIVRVIANQEVNQQEQLALGQV